MTPLRKMARALAKDQSGCDCFDDLEPEAQEALRENVRAVLGAIREPSEEMKGDGALRIYRVSQSLGTIAQAEGAWQAMLDTALSE